MYKIRFSGLVDIHMGSPYNIADIHVIGGYFPENVSDEAFQDRCAVSIDGQTCFVVVWDRPNNDPGFRVWKVSNQDRSVKKSDRISGCCQEVSLSGDGVSVVVWEYEKPLRTETVTDFK